MRCRLIIVALLLTGFPHSSFGQRLSTAHFTKQDTGTVHQPATPSFTSADFSAGQTKLLPVKDNFYATHLSFFCTQEIKMEQVHVPLIFRVGSVENCNYLEQKTGSTIR